MIRVAWPLFCVDHHCISHRFFANGSKGRRFHSPTVPVIAS
jgi:hypothetical protein